MLNIVSTVIIFPRTSFSWLSTASWNTRIFASTLSLNDAAKMAHQSKDRSWAVLLGCWVAELLQLEMGMSNAGTASAKISGKARCKNVMQWKVEHCARAALKPLARIWTTCAGTVTWKQSHLHYKVGLSLVSNSSIVAHSVLTLWKSELSMHYKAHRQR